ncbi:unnamed protein product [Amoebophrya sp. A120]|nr:unnamed protein product [Amoebophrya sp. A120]|eukprot:GSA120T00005473001.1
MSTFFAEEMQATAGAVGSAATWGPQFTSKPIFVNDGTLFDYYRSAITVIFIFVVLWTPLYLAYNIVLSVWNQIKYGNASGDPVEEQYESKESAALSASEKIAIRRRNQPVSTATKAAFAVAILALVVSKEPLVWRAYGSAAAGDVYEWVRAQFSPFNFYVHGSSCVHYGCIWLLSLPCLMCPLIPTLRATKIQENKDPASLKDWIYVGVALVANAVLIQTPLAMGLHFYVEFFQLGVTWDTVFTLEQAFPRLLLCMMIEDVFHYWGHYFFHTRMYWYKTVHKWHHSYPNPFGLEAEFAHPIETMVLGTGFFVALHVNILHYLYILLWMWVRVCTTTDVHMGYSAPVFPWRYIVPYWTGVEHHDFHHRFFTANYAPSFEWWDRWMGTDEPYEKFRVREKLAQANNRLEKQELRKYGKYVPWLLREASSKKFAPEEADKAKLPASQDLYAKNFAGAGRMAPPKSCAITGGAGLVGKVLVETLVERGCKKIVLVDLADEPAWVKDLQSVEYKKVDIAAAKTAVAELAAAFANVECVLHLAALVGPYFEHEQYTRVNIDGARHVLQACEQANVKALVDVSSPSTRFDGFDMEGLDEEDMDMIQREMKTSTHEYARTKAVGEKIILKAHGTSSVKTCAVAPHQVYGEQDKLFLPNMLGSMHRLRQFGNEPLVMSFTHTTNIAHGTLLAARALLNDQEGVGGEFFVITDGIVSSFWNRMDDARKVAFPDWSDSKSLFRKLYVPKNFMLLLSHVWSRLQFALVYLFCGFNRGKAIRAAKLTPFAVNMLCIHRYLDASKAKHRLGYLPLEDGTEAWGKSVDAVAKRMKL